MHGFSFCKIICKPECFLKKKVEPWFLLKYSERKAHVLHGINLGWCSLEKEQKIYLVDVNIKVLLSNKQLP